MNRKKLMNGNELIVLGVLKQNPHGLTRVELAGILLVENALTGEISDLFSYPTLINILKSLKGKGLITVSTDRSPVYKAVRPNSLIDQFYIISEEAIEAVLLGRITRRAFQIYCLLLYMNHTKPYREVYEQDENLLIVSHSDVADDLSISRSRVTDMINMLVSEGLLSIWGTYNNARQSGNINVYKFVFLL